MTTTFFCISDRESATTRELLRAACLQRRIAFETIHVAAFDFSEPAPADVGDIVYNAATSARAAAIEVHLVAPGVAALGTALTAGQAAIGGATQIDIMERSGVPVVASLPCHGRDRGTIKRAVEHLGGGYPIVVKVPGGEGGVGVMLVESQRSLFSLLDYLVATGTLPVLSTFIARAEHWRVIVLGGRTLASYLNEPIEGDFRTFTSNDPSLYALTPPAGVNEAALAAAAALDLGFAGVDVLVDDRGSPFVIEANSPCYFAPAQTIGGVDVAGALVDHLLAKTSEPTT